MPDGCYNNYAVHSIVMCIIIGFTPFVSLTVEEEVSLVGEHCPGTVRLFCEGVDLTQLRWRYNGANRVYSFMTTDLPMSAVPSNPAFVHVQLINVTQTPSDPRFAQFISVLTVDITQLHSQNIASISCGDSGTIATEQVSVIPQQPSVPNSPVITAVTATYMSDLLITLEASWMELVVSTSYNTHACSPININYYVSCRRSIAWDLTPHLYTC